MIDLFSQLPFWLQGPEIEKWAAAFKSRAAAWEAWCNEALAQADIANCSEAALAAHARDRGIERLPGETVALWRNRVLHAFTTATESGSRAGLEYILGVYGVQNFTVRERVAGLDWDIVLIDLDPDVISGDSAVMDRIFHKWGRTCRRYALGHTLEPANYWGTGTAAIIKNVGQAA